MKGPFGEKKILEKKVSQGQTTERVFFPLVFFNILAVAKHQKIERGKIFKSGKRSHSARKTERGVRSGVSNI